MSGARGWLAAEHIKKGSILSISLVGLRRWRKKQASAKVGSRQAEKKVCKLFFSSSSNAAGTTVDAAAAAALERVFLLRNGGGRRRSEMGVSKSLSRKKV